MARPTLLAPWDHTEVWGHKGRRGSRPGLPRIPEEQHLPRPESRAQTEGRGGLRARSLNRRVCGARSAHPASLSLQGTSPASPPDVSEHGLPLTSWKRRKGQIPGLHRRVLPAPSAAPRLSQRGKHGLPDTHGCKRLHVTSNNQRRHFRWTSRSPGCKERCPAWFAVVELHEDPRVSPDRF